MWYELLYKLPEGSETFFETLECSEAFSWVVSIFFMLVSGWRHSLMYWGVLKHFETFPLILSSSERCMKVLRPSLTSCDVIRRSDVF